MTTIHVNSNLSNEEFSKLTSIYENNLNVSVEFYGLSNQKKIKRLVDFLIQQQMNEFNLFLLANLVEMKNFPEESLATVFSLGDTACKVAICMKKNLPEKIKSLCKLSDNEHVIEHYNQS